MTVKSNCRSTFILYLMKIKAILSDFDGTLCPTSSIDHNSNNDDNSNFIPIDVEDLLLKISKEIPICIISSKDFYFLYDRVKKFSDILSCILGMETLSLDNKNAISLDNNKITDVSSRSLIDKEHSIVSRHLLVDHETLLTNSSILNEISSFFEIK